MNWVLSIEFYKEALTTLKFGKKLKIHALTRRPLFHVRTMSTSTTVFDVPLKSASPYKLMNNNIVILYNFSNFPYWMLISFGQNYRKAYLHNIFNPTVFVL